MAAKKEAPRIYSLELAVQAAAEVKAMNRLKAIGVSSITKTKLSDLDHHADLFIIRTDVEESILTDEVYKKLEGADDVFILVDELSVERSKEIMDLTSVIEKQLKKLLIYVLPEIDKVLVDVISIHQKHKTKIEPTGRIAWCKIINNFSFGELPFVLKEDVSLLTKTRLLSGDGLLSLVASAKDFDELKRTVLELSESKTVWDSVNAILVKSIDYNNISSALDDLCNARNNAAHFKTITAKCLKKTKKNQEHIMTHIGKTKSRYQEELKENMKRLSKAINPAIESIAKIDPDMVMRYQKQMARVFKPLTEVVTRLNIDFIGSQFSQINPKYKQQITDAALIVEEKIKHNSEYVKIVEKIAELGATGFLEDTLEETTKLKTDIPD